MPSRPRAGLAAAIDFLLARQGDDGLWRDFWTPAGEASTWPTGYIAHALTLAGADHGSLRRAAVALARCQQPGGGWGYNEQTPCDADSTAWAVLFLTSLGSHGRAARHAGECLARHQRRGGGVATFAQAGPIRRYTGLPRWMPFRGWCQPQVEVSAVAGRAFAALSSSELDNRAMDAWRQVRSRQSTDGSWPSYWWTTPHVATHQAAALALRMRDAGPVRRAAGWALRGQRPDGGWCASGTEISPFATALATSMLAQCRLDEPAPVSRGVDALLRLQEPDGGWPSHPILRVPLPPDRRPAGERRWRPVQLGEGIVVEDQHRTFTTATCVAALAAAARTAR